MHNALERCVGEWVEACLGGIAVSLDQNEELQDGDVDMEFDRS